MTTFPIALFVRIFFLRKINSAYWNCCWPQVEEGPTGSQELREIGSKVSYKILSSVNILPHFSFIPTLFLFYYYWYYILYIAWYTCTYCCILILLQFINCQTTAPNLTLTSQRFQMNELYRDNRFARKKTFFFVEFSFLIAT